MKILVVSQYFYPENFRINDLCLEFQKDGHDVTVLTGIPNYPEGKFFDGYGLGKKRMDFWNGMKIIRVPMIPRMKNPLGLILNYISFALSGSLYVKFNKMEQFDMVYVFEVSPISVAFPAITYKKKYKSPIAMNVQDLWPENVQAITGVKSPFIINRIGKMVDYIYDKCDLLLTSSPRFNNKIIERGHPPEKIVYWPQYANESFEKTSNTNHINDELAGKYNLVFTGNLGYAQGLHVIVDAANTLKNRKDIHWYFIGDGRARAELENQVEKLGLQETVRFLGRKAEHEIPAYLSYADGALLVLKEDEIFEMTLPAKLQSYLACEVPILSCLNGVASEVVNEANCGFTAIAGDFSGLAASVEELLSLNPLDRAQKGKNGRLYFEQHFTKQKLLAQLYEYFDLLLESKK